jgi:hypothetical protein
MERVNGRQSAFRVPPPTGYSSLTSIPVAWYEQIGPRVDGFGLDRQGRGEETTISEMRAAPRVFRIQVGIWIGSLQEIRALLDVGFVDRSQEFSSSRKMLQGNLGKVV